MPLGFIEITNTGSRWVPLEPPRAELVLRALTAIALIAPGGQKGFFRRLLLVAAAQALLSQFTRPRAPQLPEGLPFGREAA
jgi:hypothetical protein